MSDQYTTLQYELMKLLSSVTNQGASAESMKNATAASAVTPTSVRAAATILTMRPGKITAIFSFKDITGFPALFPFTDLIQIFQNQGRFPAGSIQIQVTKAANSTFTFSELQKIRNFILSPS